MDHNPGMVGSLEKFPKQEQGHRKRSSVPSGYGIGFQGFPIEEERCKTERTEDRSNQQISGGEEYCKGSALPSADQVPDQKPAEIPKSEVSTW